RNGDVRSRMFSHCYFKGDAMLKAIRIRIFTSFFAVMIIVFFSSAALAQSIQGSINGGVKDPSGASVVGAKIVLTNTDEGTIRSTTSNSSGGYQFLDVKSSHYQL